MSKSEEVKKIEALNPFDEGVTYESFLKSIGKQSVKEALKGKCTDDEIKWIEEEITNFKNNKK